MTTNNLHKITCQVSNIAIQAGIVINQHYKSKTKITFKDDKSPLTQADLESNTLIKNSLSELDFNIPILTEESLVDWPIRKKWNKYWLVDPLDGTKEFIKHKEDFSVNIALIENHSPILGVIYAPISRDLYFAYKAGGSYKLNIKEEEVKIADHLNNSIKLKVSNKSKNDLLKILGSKSHPNENFKKWLDENVNTYEIISKGSSLKFCYLAEGIADLYPRFRPSCEWDIAAGHIILSEAGGKLLSIDKKEILYNKKESVINPSFVASCNLYG
tara:strand:+ start:8408 stop:9223 length:816 start_codon:yes stop_codon:yes gene_type:complete